MKKNVLIYLTIAIIVIGIISFIFILKSKNEIKDQNEITKIVTNSNLELILNLGNFNSEDYSEENLLQTAMMFAERNAYLNESNDENYFEYINYTELHDIIYELTGITVEAPIQIEDFYYRYDSENEYYYCVPLNFSTYELSNINHIYKNDDTYTIECTATKTEDGEIIEEKTVTTTFKYIENNFYSNYQIVSQNFS